MRSLLNKTFGSRRVAAALAVATVAPAFVAGPVLASGGGGGGGGVLNGGACSTVSRWTLEVKANGQGLQVRASVFSLPQTTWTWKLVDNRTKLGKGTAVTDQEHQDEGFFQIRRNTADQQGADTIHLVATQTQTREVCNGSVTI